LDGFEHRLRIAFDAKCIPCKNPMPATPRDAADARQQNPSGSSVPNPAQLCVQTLRAHPNLLQRNFDVASPNKAWVTDITYIRTWQGWLYLAVIMDLFSGKIVGWSTRPTIARELVLDAVLMAVHRRRPRGTVIHSDQGSQYGSDDWRRFCKTNHLEPSMSRRGNCWDDAVAESFFRSLKNERVKKKIYRTRELAQAEIS
jgi:putative transposase